MVQFGPQLAVALRIAIEIVLRMANAVVLYGPLVIKIIELVLEMLTRRPNPGREAPA